VAVQVGFIACFGMADGDGIICSSIFARRLKTRGLEKDRSLAELRDSVIEGPYTACAEASHRRRGDHRLAPMLWPPELGHEIISAMAAPVLGGLLIADEVVDIFIPVRFY